VALNSQKIAKAIKTVTGCPRVGTIVAGFEVPHYHLHLIPAWSIPDLDFKRAKRLSQAEMKSLQQKITEELK
jgi:histidine triad (HIT) family protein